MMRIVGTKKRTHVSPRSRAPERSAGFVMLITLILLLTLMVTAVFVLRSKDSEFRAGSKTRKSEILRRAAEAGLAARLSEMAIASSPASLLDGQSQANGTWNAWPERNIFDDLQSQERFTMGEAIAYRTSNSLSWTGGVPPPGFPIGTHTYVFEVKSFASFNIDSGALSASQPVVIDHGEAVVTVSIKTWDSHPASYGQ